MKKIYLLNEQKHEDVENLEVFQIEYIKSDVDLKKYDALVFTSKNGVKAINSFNQDWKNIPSYAIAQKTANTIMKLGGVVEFIGNSGHGNDFAYELKNVLKDKKVLYVKALKTVSNLPNILKENGIFLDEIIAYKTSCKKSNIILEENSIFIFTSPSSVECFFKQYSWKNSYKAIVIGKTTAEFLPSNINYEISSQTSVEECIKLAKQLS
ncbi:uroporphyrinogen-III synthase [Aliarcobacter butzleri]|jgi:uroporphyrinogen-III synthase|uniref:uroporphyrinogen-III synthase n=1 Tax=Aliarcobacter butzleri TaxID=28197 RepID=UPI00125F849E|nr:uroporphyrinogen-III synthase [Aliarcobacter butzleri]MCG3655488.1 uroporphyrinogen-III synthase [Aliarcobacter butzleri]MCT7553367.1 uroporphyrinogen-III synthase [Aliarcobacter butzleri]MCT7582525.1 uroporphyrinogen-III synthase [Aliarcobacter butzleri]MCT7634638.1 uroporphyrinogen-III synthase [Aliarcobacter butzleri]MDK2049883.1 uroporphyrinogen-III synthase [Aliarcobacter butzleri]